MSLTLVAPLIAAAVVAVAALVLRIERARQRHLVGRRVIEDGPLSSDRPTLLYFTGEACAICHAAQRPAVRRVAADLGEHAVIREVDVAAEPHLARSFRVMTLPTTVVIGPAGAVTAVNTGFAPAERLLDQLREAAVRTAA